MKDKRKFYIGCSGFYYSQWKGSFYPTGVPASKWLNHYSSIFNSVELNSSFYRMPQLSAMKKQFSNTPDDFRFSVKVSRYITHILRLRNAAQYIADFRNHILDGYEYKLHKLLFQLPPSFHFNEENVALINAINWTDDCVIEFRHHSWWNKETEQIMKKANCTFCNVDFPGLESYFINTSNDFYLRLHGNPELFKSSYNSSQLSKYFEEMPRGSNTYSIYFNNTYYDAAYKNALEMIRIVESS